MTANTDESESRAALQSWFKSLRKPDLSKDEVLKIYDEWVETSNYDSDLLNEGYEAPALTVKYFCDDFPAEKKIDAKIIDVGAGTGLVARGLRAQGFEHIDALDPSATMLSVAKKNNLYENYFCEFLTDKELPIAPDTYDGLTASGCFGVCLIPCDALHEMIRIVKPGGIIVIVTKDDYTETIPQYKGRLSPLMKSLEEQGKWKRLVEETGLPYCMDERAVVWKYQVLGKSRK